ncbi:flagellar basal body P-ring formation chaperone FlgA [Undibacterium sp. Di24W]|uniref:flagellar basal body P-ring formation chaperone FlgA n=1 Tax=Undibacterium sp. Di24W TaxID=3413033 RepID=UPI003BF13FC9
MKKLKKLICVFFTCSLAFNLSAQVTQNIDSATIIREAEIFLKNQTKLLEENEGKVEITVNKLDPRLKLQACDQLVPFLTPGSKAWGKITIGVQCSTPKPWTIYLGANVKVSGGYFVTNKAVSMGQMLTEQDLVKIQGEISSLPPGTITDEKQAIGKTMLANYPAGVNLRKEMFKLIPVIQQGQSIKVSSSGNGFTVSNEATALNNAAEGQVAKAKTAGGQIISGIARVGGVIEVN